MQKHVVYLQQALALAAQQRGFCAPNPSVGAVVVKDDKILATGFHRGSGTAHAEVDALNKLNKTESRGATVYVTLEPCCHWGKTPPCTSSLIERGIAQVYYGFEDPNPAVSGQGARMLQEAGIPCQRIKTMDIDNFYQSYAYWRNIHQPYVTAKLALSIDGKIAQADGKPVAITGKMAQEFTHQWRKRSDAILTTATTIKNDDPQLNIRLHGETWQKPLYVLDRTLSLSPQAKIFKTAAKVIILYGKSHQTAQLKILEKHGAQCFAIAEKDNKLDLPAALDQIGAAGIQDLWVEAGGKCFTSLAQAELLQRAFIFIGGKILGNQAIPAFVHASNIVQKAQHKEWQIWGEDVLLTLDNFNYEK